MPTIEAIGKLLGLLDTPGGHILVGLVLLGLLIGCKAQGINDGTQELLAGLIGVSLGQSLRRAGDGV
jgi:hypothetical protein